MKEQQVSQLFDELAEEGVPASVDLWPGLQARLAQQPHVPARADGRVVLRWASLTLVTLVVLAALALGATRVVEWIRPAGGSHQVATAGLTGPSQTVGGVTIFMPHTSIEADSLVIGLVISATDPQRYAPYQITLTNAAGIMLPRMIGQGLAGTCVISDADPGPGNGYYTFTFAIRREISTAAQLRLTVQLRDRPDVSVVAPLSSTIGPFYFTFTVSVDPAGVVEEANQRISESTNQRINESANQRVSDEANQRWSNEAIERWSDWLLDVGNAGYRLTGCRLG